MDAVFTAARFSEPHHAQHCARRLMILVAVSLFTSIGLAGVYGLVRRFTGGIATPLPAGALVFCGILLATMLLTARLAVEHFHLGFSSRRLRILTRTLPAVSALLVASALSLPGSSAWGLFGLWGLVFAAAGIAHARPRAGSTRRTIRKLGVRQISLEDEAGGQVNQRWVRRSEANGVEAIEGWVRADFAAGARVTHVHTTFCPPFASTPLVEAEPVEGPPATLKIGPVYPHGARVEIRLEHPTSEPSRVAIALFAHGVGATSGPS